MPVNADKPLEWKKDVARSVDYYNNWFMNYAPVTYRETRLNTTDYVVSALHRTNNLNNISPDLLRESPGVIAMMRMSTAPPLAVDRLIGLSGVSSTLVKSMEKKKRVPPLMSELALENQLKRIGEIVYKLADRDIFTWLEDGSDPSETDLRRAATIIADRLTGAIANPLIKNAQEERQLQQIGAWLEERGYVKLASRKRLTHEDLEPGTFSFRFNVPIVQVASSRSVNIPVDVVIQPKHAAKGDFPLLIEAKSAGDFTNTNKRRKEEATKINQLRATYGDGISFILFLCGYFDTGYLGYEAAEGIDWVWEHRIADLELFGL